MNRKFNLIFKKSDSPIEFENRSFTNVTELKDYLPKFLFDFYFFISITSCIDQDFCVTIDFSSISEKEN